MAEHPILFTSDMVKAILAGHKTQTRRIGTRYDSWQVGDLIWVRETWKPTHSFLYGGTYVRYRADGARLDVPHDMGGTSTDKWRPSIFMPRWASRLTLEITGLREERLQKITAEDEVREGADTILDNYPHQMFEHLWDSINGKKPGRAWADNPTVKVIEFEVKHE